MDIATLNKGQIISYTFKLKYWMRVNRWPETSRPQGGGKEPQVVLAQSGSRHNCQAGGKNTFVLLGLWSARCWWRLSHIGVFDRNEALVWDFDFCHDNLRIKGNIRRLFKIEYREEVTAEWPKCSLLLACAANKTWSAKRYRL